MTILVDMDDVMEQLVAGWIALLNERYGTNTRYEDVTSWNIAEAFPTLTEEQVYAVEMEDVFWDYVEPMPGADEALRRMIADGHEIFVVTATKYQTLRKKMETVLFPNFPYIDWHHVIVTYNKHLIKGDVLIDDGPHNLTRGDFRKILFTRGHNQDFDESSVGAIRVRNWEEAYQAVCRIASEKEGSR